MKILISAYACEPNKGSEPGVGWNWATELSKIHEVWVITRDNNEPTINAYLKNHTEYQNDKLHFVYVGLSRKLTFWKKGRRGMRLFYFLWQKKAVRKALKINKEIKFDVVHHVTFASYTQPTYMYKLGIPLIWGPVSGGENIPKGIRIKMNNKEKIIELIRKTSQYLALMTPSIKKTMKYSKKIIVTTEETKDKIPQKYWGKTEVIPAIGISELPEIKKQKKESGKIKIVMAGRLIYWKAFEIGVKAFLQIADKYPDLELHILGEGDKKSQLKKISGKYLEKQVFFDNPVEHDKIYQYYSGFDIFLNTTLRDSGCMTMMEAMSVGIPCVAISAGGPYLLSKESPESLITPDSYDDCVNKISEILEKMVTDKKFLINVQENQKKGILENYIFDSKIENIYKCFS